MFLARQTEYAPMTDNIKELDAALERAKNRKLKYGHLTLKQVDDLLIEQDAKIASLLERSRLYDAALSRLADYAEDIRKLTEENERMRRALEALDDDSNGDAVPAFIRTIADHALYPDREARAATAIHTKAAELEQGK